jgi:hypothetical protein
MRALLNQSQTEEIHWKKREEQQRATLEEQKLSMEQQMRAQSQKLDDYAKLVARLQEQMELEKGQILSSAEEKSQEVASMLVQMGKKVREAEE